MPQQQRLSDKKAREYFELRRWPGRKIRCPACGSAYPILNQQRDDVEGYYRCPKTELHREINDGRPYVFTVRTGTVLARSHVPLSVWLIAFDLIYKLGDTFSIKDFGETLELHRRTTVRVVDIIRQLQQRSLLANGVTGKDPNQFLRDIVNERGGLSH